MVTLIVNDEEMKKYKSRKSKEAVLKQLLEAWETKDYGLNEDDKQFHFHAF
jgi:hypothetical protein